LEVLNLDPLRDFDRYRVQERDIILTARGTVVRAAVVEPAQSGAVAGPNLIVIRPQPDLEPDLLAAYLRHPSMQTRLLAQRVGSVTLGFTTSQVAALKIAVPVLAHQQHLAQLVRLADAYYEKASQAAMARRDLVADLVLGVLHPHAERSADA
jgi:restriction endonuclease S subunit